MNKNLRTLNLGMAIGWLLVASVGLYFGVVQNRPIVPAGLLAVVILAAIFYKIFFPPPRHNFEEIGDQEVRSDLGFVVRLTGSSLQYIEEDHVLTLQGKPVGEGVFKQEITHERLTRWDPPFDAEGITEEKNRQIKANLMAAMSFFRLGRFRDAPRAPDCPPRP